MGDSDGRRSDQPMSTRDDLPVIDRTRLSAQNVGAALSEWGFLGIRCPELLPALTDMIEDFQDFFALQADEKRVIAMDRGGTAWRGWFPFGGELTSGRVDLKEGVYFGREQREMGPQPLTGPNLWPASPPRLRRSVNAWMDMMEALGLEVADHIAVYLGLEPGHFSSDLLAEPTVLFRAFRYAPPTEDVTGTWGVGEHTDYGLLTLLATDGNDGLEIHSPHGWQMISAPPEVIFVNIGDMLERLSNGRMRSTPHRVRASAQQDRLSFPFFLDPGWNAEIVVLDHLVPTDAYRSRWDGTDLATISGVYGDYLLSKISKVFPELFAASIAAPARTSTSDRQTSSAG